MHSASQWTFVHQLPQLAAMEQLGKEAEISSVTKGKNWRPSFRGLPSYQVSSCNGPSVAMSHAFLRPKKNHFGFSWSQKREVLGWKAPMH